MPGGWLDENENSGQRKTEKRSNLESSVTFCSIGMKSAGRIAGDWAFFRCLPMYHRQPSGIKPKDLCGLRGQRFIR